jgi:hypothetical protein
MRAAAAVEHSISFAGRLATALVELALATAVIVGAIIVGHDLREWRDWYPTAYHPWNPIAEPTSTPEVTEP